MDKKINEVFQTDAKNNKKDENGKSNKILFFGMLTVLLVIGFFIFKPLFSSSPTEKQKKKQSKTSVSTSYMDRSIAPTDEGNNVTDRLNAQEMQMESIRKNIELMQQEQQSLYRDLGDKIEAFQTMKGTSVGEVISQLNRPSRLSERFTADYQKKVAHFKKNQENGWQLDPSKYEQLTSPQKQYKSISVSDTTGGSLSTTGFDYNVPAGSRIIAVTEQPVNSDHPGYFTSRIVRPEVLRGATLICQNGPQQNNRIPVAVTKIVFNNVEYQVTGQVEMGFPGMTGSINRHITGRLLPVIANAAISGSFIAWSATNPASTRIDTRDAITGAVVEQTLPQVQNEVSKFSTDRPNTVEVASGTQFGVLLTEKLNLRYSL